MPNLSKRSILYVEDDKTIVESMTILLENYFSDVYLASNGKEGLELFDRHTPDIVMSDISMPEMDGLEMSRQIKQRCPDTPIILLTAFEEPAKLKQAIELGIDSYLVKPLQSNRLQSALNKAQLLLESTEAIIAKEKLLESLNASQSIAKVGTFEDYQESREIFLSDEGCRMWDVPVGSTLFREELVDKVHPDDQGNVLEQIRRVTEAHEDILVSFRIVNAEGSLKYVEAKATAVFNESGEFRHVRGTFQDITERVETERLREYRQFSQMKDNLLHNISHEIRTPLNGMMGMLGFLARKFSSDASLKKYVDTFLESGRRMDKLTSRVLMLADLQSGNYTLAESTGVLHRQLNDVLRGSLNRAEEKGIAFQTDITGTLPAKLLYDTSLVEIALNELVDNAIAFTQEGGSIQIVETYDPDTHQLVFDVIDTGIGMDEATLRDTNELFYQGDMSMTRAVDGAGIGLDIVRSIVRQMNGELTLESIPGEGTTARMTLTACAPDATHHE
jgi:signal transduction histidine kinase